MPKTPDTAKKVILTEKLKRYIDLNTDYGQTGEAAYFADPDNNLLTYASSVNIPCCVHDGDPLQMMEHIAQAKQFNCAIGAHIAYPDPVNLGYKEMTLSDEELAAWIHVQIGAFRSLTQAVGLDIEHVRPHGALYGKLINDPHTARVVAETLYKMNPWLILVGPFGPVLEEVHQKVGIRVAPEVYLGKRYNAEGTLIRHRFHENLTPQGVLDQAKQLISESALTTQDGKTLKVKFSSLHISPKLNSSIEIAEKLNAILGQAVSLPIAAVGASGWV
jgi:UPF0271 protein